MMTYTRIIALFLMAATGSAAEVNPGKAPNIMLILVDDMGYSDLGCYGGEIHTPAIDHLAANGLRYSQFYNCARCVPSRAALLSGYYPQQINRDSVLDIEGGARGKRPSWARLLPAYLKPAGYRSYHSGKWHIDGKPTESGFDRSLYVVHGDRYFSPKTLFTDDKQYTPEKSSKAFYATTAIADHAIEVLREHQRQHADAPFFSFVAFTAPHFPLQALPEDIERVGDRYRVGWEVIRSQRWERIQQMGLVKGELSAVERDLGPPYAYPEQLKVLGDGEIDRPVPWDTLSKEQQEFQEMKMRLHAAMIERIDIEVSRIVEELRAMNALENTVIFFLSDNGASAEMMVRGDGHDPQASPGSAGSYLCLGPGWSTVANTPFRKHKIWTHEGGSCTPLIVHWPKQIPQGGGIQATPGHVIDFVPTILDLAGVERSGETVAFPGRSLRPSFGESSGSKRRLWWSHKGNQAIRDGDWKLVKTSAGEWELYHISKDRAETANLADQYPEKVEELTKKWKAQVEQIRQVKKLK